MEDMNSETSTALVENDDSDPDYIKHKGCMYNYIDLKKLSESRVSYTKCLLKSISTKDWKGNKVICSKDQSKCA